MPKYLVQASYTSEGVKGLHKEGGSSRRAAIEKLLGSLGGKLEAFYFAFGDTDVYLIVDLPDHVSAAAVGLVTNASGTVNVKTTVLLTPEEIDAAAKKTPIYRAAGQ
jgi:uncharacterized protein with GYD domain